MNETFFEKMDYCVLILTIGIPGCGKSTWVKEYTKKHPCGTYVISTDAIRKEITGVEQCINPSQNDMIHEEARKRAKQIIDNREEISKKLGTWPVIIIDSTNVDVEEWIAYKQLGASVMLAKVFDVKPEDAMNNMKNRERRVPLEILQWKWRTLEKNRAAIPKLFNMQLFSI